MICDDLEEWDGVKVGGKLKGGGGYMYIMPDFMLLYKQKLTHHCKAIILQIF